MTHRGDAHVVAGVLRASEIDNPLGCPACPAPIEGDVVVDDRGRVWHVECALLALGEVTRRDELRGAAYRYAYAAFTPTCGACGPKGGICRLVAGHIMLKTGTNEPILKHVDRGDNTWSPSDVLKRIDVCDVYNYLRKNPAQTTTAIASALARPSRGYIEDDLDALCEEGLVRCMLNRYWYAP